MGLICDETVRVTVCTLSEALLERLRGMLTHWACSECVSLSVEPTVQFPHQEKGGAHLLILDIDSVELPEPERGELEKKAGLIIISRDAGRAIRSFRWHPAAFLKPDFDAQRLAAALGACEKHWRRGKICLESPYRRRGFRLPLGSVRYIEASAHYSVFNQGKGRQPVRIRFAINELAELLPEPPFVRCHRGYLVHLDAVARMSYTTLTLKNETSLPLGRMYVSPLRAQLQAWQGEEMHNDDIHHGL